MTPSARCLILSGKQSLLDVIKTPTKAAYSLRRLRRAYNGPVVNVRRSSDNATQDIRFVGAGDFDSSAFTAFIGGGTGFVATWYDQSGNNLHLVQATQAAQPQLLLNQVGGRPSLSPAGAHYLTSPVSSLLDFPTDHTVFTVLQFTSAVQMELYSRFSSDGSFNGWATDVLNGFLRVYSCTDSATLVNGLVVDTLRQVNTGTPHLLGYTHTGSGKNVQILADGLNGTGAVAEQNPITTTGRSMYLFAADEFPSAPDTFYTGQVPEHIIWGSVLRASDIAALNASTHSYYSTP